MITILKKIFDKLKNKKENNLIILFSELLSFFLILKTNIFKPTINETIIAILNKVWLFLFYFGCIYFILKVVKFLLQNIFIIKKDNSDYTKKENKKLIIIFFLFFFIFLNQEIVMYISNNYGQLNAEQIIFNLFGEKKGIAEEQKVLIIFGPILQFILLMSLSSYYLFYNYIVQYKNEIILNRKRFINYMLIILTVLWGIGFVEFANTVKFVDVIKQILISSKFIEKNYIYEDEIIVPQEKRNLIHIYIESMESSFMDKNNGGLLEENLIPNLTNLAKENTNNHFKGAIQTSGGGWTIAGHINSELGLPLKTYIGGNAYGSDGKFLPNANSLGKILDENQYQQIYIAGSDLEFAGTKSFLKNHGNYEVHDLNYYKSIGKIPEDYNVNWGFEDSLMFDFAKEELLKIDKNKPFNLTLRTANSHFPDGYLEENGEQKFQTQYENVIYHTDKQIYDFIKWIEEQDFYKNTTIVIQGDHISMNSEILKGTNDNDRRVYFTIINPIKQINYDREYSMLDFYPTILESLGFDIVNDKLGLGTSLLSNQKNLIEEYDHKKLNDFSEFYIDLMK